MNDQKDRRGFRILIIPLLLTVLIGCSGESPSDDPVQTGLSNEPDPTAISRSIPMAQTCPTSEEQAYFTLMSLEAKALGDYLKQMAILTQRMILDPVLIIDDFWKADVELNLWLIKNTADTMEGLDPPPSVASLHQDVVQASRAYKQFTVLFTNAVDQADGVLLEGASDYLILGNDSLFAATRKADRFCQTSRSASKPISMIPATPTHTPLPTETPIPDRAPRQIPTPYPTPMMIVTALPFPTSIPPTIVPSPTPTPNGPLMAQEECQSVVNDYMGSIIESAILERADEPMDFRYWTEGRSGGQSLGYFLQYQEYSGFGEKPTHHRVFGNVLIHWWNNEIELFMLEYFPHPVTCLPRSDAVYEDSGAYLAWFVYQDVEFSVVGHAGDTEDPMIYLGELGEPTRIVEVEEN